MGPYIINKAGGGGTWCMCAPFCLEFYIWTRSGFSPLITEVHQRSSSEDGPGQWYYSTGQCTGIGRMSDRKSPSLHAWKALQAINFDSSKLGVAAGLVLEFKICVLAETLHHIAQLLHWGESLLGLWHCAFPRVSPATVDLLRQLNLHARPSSCLPDFISTKTRS